MKVMSHMHTEIDAGWIDRWAGSYDDDDDKVLKEVRLRVSRRNHYDLEDLVRVGVWKGTYRIKPKLEHNTEEWVRDVTTAALVAPDALRIHILTALRGVGQPVASALLMVWNQDQYTPIDRRAVNTLVAAREIDAPGRGKYPPYRDYLDVCRSISQRCDRSLRTLDRALYMADGRV
jgi:hypothetical protein